MKVNWMMAMLMVGLLAISVGGCAGDDGDGGDPADTTVEPDVTDDGGGGIDTICVPEPTTICLLGLGALAMLRRRRA